MIYELLSEGKENKRTRQELLRALDIPWRVFQDILRRERREGHIILSTKEDGGGYWIWDGENIEELRRYDAMQRSGAIDTLTTLKPIYKILKENKETAEG